MEMRKEGKLMAKEGLTIEKMVELKVQAELSILKHIREQVDQFVEETEIPVNQVSVKMVDISTIGHRDDRLIVDVTLEIKL